MANLDSPPPPSERVDQAVRVADVDMHPSAHRATEPDEEQVLRELYGAPDSNGIYHGQEVT